MTWLLSGIVKWLLRQAATLLLILAVLLGGAWFGGEFKKIGDLREDRAREVAKRDALLKRIEALKGNAAERAKTADSAIRNHQAMLERARADRASLSKEHFVARWIPLSEVWQRIRQFDIEIEVSQRAIEGAVRLKESTERELNALVKQTQIEIEKVNKGIANIEEKLNQGTIRRSINVAYQELPFAIGILLGVVLVPIGIKVLLYFAIAPLAAKCPPVRLLPATSGNIRSTFANQAVETGMGKMSSVSLPIVLGENQELLIQAEYLQSTSLQSRKKTKWLLNSSIPFSSLLSGMFMLIQVNPAESEQIVISAKEDDLSEVGIVDLTAGSAFVCQPRALAGVIQDRRYPIRITRHWRLGSLQSWLTLQLRFLVFHGPGQLVLKGCRGIRIESAGTGRLINQAATLGFSANLDYANVRCETFVSYWSGKEDLFYDLFKGASGVYVYEEMPDSGRTTGIGKRPLEGLADAVLKIFGI